MVDLIRGFLFTRKLEVRRGGGQLGSGGWHFWAAVSDFYNRKSSAERGCSFFFLRCRKVRWPTFFRLSEIDAAKQRPPEQYKYTRALSSDPLRPSADQTLNTRTSVSRLEYFLINLIRFN